MKIVSAQDLKDKKVLLRLDLDVPVGQVTGGRLQITEDFRLRAGLATLKLCVENASKVIVIGHLGRPRSVNMNMAGPKKIDAFFSLKPVCEWFGQNGFPKMTFDPSTSFDSTQNGSLRTGQDSDLVMLENLRFNPGEESLDMDFAKKLASLADIFVFEAFASYRPAVSTTVLPKLLPHFAGLQFVREVEAIRGVRENPKKPFVAIMGGAKAEDKLPVIEVLARKADTVLVGGKIASELTKNPTIVSKNVLVARLNENGLDITPETVESWKRHILGAAQIIWNGPVGKFEDPKNDATRKLAQIILSSNAEIVIGGGDTIAALNQAGLLERVEEKAFVSTGGGTMLKLLSDGSLPTIEALK